MNGANIVHNELKLILEGHSYFHDLAFTFCDTKVFVIYINFITNSIYFRLKIIGYIDQYKPYHKISKNEEIKNRIGAI